MEIAEITGDPWNTQIWASIDSAGAVRILPDPAVRATLFSRIRGTIRLRNGDIAVLDAGNSEVRIFDSAAKWKRSFGRRGQGPNEFEMPWRLLRGRADSLVVVDLHGFIQVFADNSDSARRVRIPWGSSTGSAQILDVFGDGNFLAIMNDLMQKPVPGLNPLYSTLHLMTPAGDSGAMLGRGISAELAFKAGPNGAVESVELLFWAEPGWTALFDSYVWCLPQRFECNVWSGNGRRIRSIRSSVSGKAVPASAYAIQEEQRLRFARSADDSARTRRAMADGVRPDVFPILSLIRSDMRDRIWMREFVWELSAETAKWLVFEPTGKILGTVILPANLQLFDIGEDYILGMDLDENDVQRVVMYPYVVRSGGL